MRRLRHQFPTELVVIGVHAGKFTAEHETENIRHAVESHGIEHPVINDTDLRIWDAYCAKAWPTLVLLDPEGYMVAKGSGEFLAEDLALLLEGVIAEHRAKGTLAPEPNAAPRPSGSRKERASTSLLRYPGKLLAPGGGRLFVADTGNHRILEITLEQPNAGRVNRIFGPGGNTPATPEEAGFLDGMAAEARFRHPRGLALAGDTLYVADTGNHAIRAIDLGAGTADSEVRTIAGTGEKGTGVIPPGTAAGTALRSPWDLLCLDRLLLVAMAGTHQIWVVAEEKALGLLAGNGSEALLDGAAPLETAFNQPSGLAYGMDHLFVADSEASAIRAIAFRDAVEVKTLLGQGLFHFGDADGTGPDVLLQHPKGVAYHHERVLVADSYNHKIKRLDPTSGETHTLAGDGRARLADGPLLSASLYQPEDIELDPDTELFYVADTNNHSIRLLDLTAGELTTLSIEGLKPD